MPDATTLRPLDALITTIFLNGEASTVSHLFPDMQDRPPIEEPADLIALLDEAGVGAAVLCIARAEHAEWVGRARAQYPRRIFASMAVDPTLGVPELRRVNEYCERYGVRGLNMAPFRYTLPPTDRVFWPFYAKAVELDLAVSMPVGMPGPRRPGWVQRPAYYDEVAFHFPELRLVLTHCGQPWIEETIAVVAHWENVALACTSVAPKYWPEALIQFINTRGRSKTLFGTDYPVLTWQRARAEIAERGLRPEVEPLFFAENAKRIYKWDAEAG